MINGSTRMPAAGMINMRPKWAGTGELLLSAGEFGMINDEKGSDLWYTVIDI
jgi:hypothetical protein